MGTQKHPERRGKYTPTIKIRKKRGDWNKKKRR